MKDIVVFPKKRRQIIFLTLSIMFVLLGAMFILLSIGEEVQFILSTIGIVSIVFFGFCAIYYWKSIKKPKPAVILSTEGILDHSSYIGAGFVGWNEIEDVTIVTMGGQHYIGFYTHDPELIIARQSGMKRLFSRMNKGFIDTQFNIPIIILDCNPEQLYKNIILYKKTYDASVHNNV